MSKPTIGVMLIVTGYEREEEVAQVLGVSSSEARARNGEWVLRMSSTDDSDLGSSVKALLARLPNARPEVAHREGWGMQVACAVTVVDETPSMAFDVSVLEQLTRLGASLDIDVIVSEAA